MTMFWQYAIMFVLGAVAAFYLGRVLWQQFTLRPGDHGCAKGCGCAPPTVHKIERPPRLRP